MSFITFFSYNANGNENQIVIDIFDGDGRANFYFTMEMGKSGTFGRMFVVDV